MATPAPPTGSPPLPPPTQEVPGLLWVAFVAGMGVGMCLLMLVCGGLWVWRKKREEDEARYRRSSLERGLREEEEMKESYSPPAVSASPLEPAGSSRKRAVSERRASLMVPPKAPPPPNNVSESSSDFASPQSSFFPNPNSDIGGSFCVRKTASSPRLSVARRRAATLVNWTKGKMLGAGTFGKVFVGVKEDGTLVAVKVLDLSSVDEQRIRSITREIDLLCTLTHEHIVDYYGCKLDQQNNELQIFMEYVSNGSLGQLVRSITDPLSISAVLEYTKQILEGVGYLHSNKIVHRDLKGDNILLTHEGLIKISDFGTSKTLGGPGQDNSICSVQGTPLWSAPEVFNGQFSPESDVWSVGCVVCELIQGRPPWPQFENVWMAIKAIAKCTGYPPEMPRCPHPCEDFLKCCFAFNPEDRSTVEELKKHFWVTIEDGEETESEETEPNHDQLPHLLRQISQINTPQHRGANQFRKVKGRLSSAAQMQWDSINLGEPELQIVRGQANPTRGSTASSSLSDTVSPNVAGLVETIRSEEERPQTGRKENGVESTEGSSTPEAG